MYEDGDTDSDPVSKAEFDAKRQATFNQLTTDWAQQLAELLGHGDDAVTVAELQQRSESRAPTRAALSGCVCWDSPAQFFAVALVPRFIITDCRMPPRRMTRLQNRFEYDVEEELSQLHLWALRNTGAPSFSILFLLSFMCVCLCVSVDWCLCCAVLALVDGSCRLSVCRPGCPFPLAKLDATVKSMEDELTTKIEEEKGRANQLEKDLETQKTLTRQAQQWANRIQASSQMHNGSGGCNIL